MQEGFYRPSQNTTFGTTQDGRSHSSMPASGHTHHPVSWEVPEFTLNQKGVLWVLGLIGVTLLLLALAVWLQVWTFAVLVVVMAVATGLQAFRKPKNVACEVNDDGFSINQKFYNFDEFRAYSIMTDEDMFTLVFSPLKRLMPGVSLRFRREEGDQILDILGDHLPMEEIKKDPFEGIMRRLRF